MSSLRYKTLLSYLPGMASVVNTFNSPQVQNSVYEKLMEALEAKLQSEGIGAPSNIPAPGAVKRLPTAGISITNSGEVAHDLVEGDSIHGDPGRISLAPSTVF